MKFRGRVMLKAAAVRIAGALGLAATVCLVSAGAVFAQSDRGVQGVSSSDSRPGTWRAIVAGVSDYTYLSRLNYADDDARAFYEYLVHPNGGKLDTADVVLLRDGAATQAALVNHLNEFLDQTREGDRLLFYFAGHGDVMQGGWGQDAYLVMPEAEKGAYSSPGMGLRMSDFQDFAEQVSAKGGQMVIVLDACRSGSVADNADGALRALSAFSERDNIIKLVSSQGDQLSWENAEWGGGHGVFTYHLLRALYGLADRLPADQSLTFLELQSFVQQEVVQATSQASYATQTPVGVASDLNAPLFDVEAEMLAEAQALEAKGFPTLIAARGGAAGEVGLDSAASHLLLQLRKAIDDGRLLDPAESSEAPASEEVASSAWSLYAALSEAVDPGDPRQSDILRRARGSLAVALQDAAQATMVKYVRGISSLPSSATFAEAGRATRHALRLFTDDYFFIDRVRASADFFDGYAIVRRRQAARYDEAEALLKRALAADSSAAHVYTALTDLARQRRDFDAALRFADDALERAPRWEYAHVRRADVLEDMGRYSEALEAYDELVRLHPGSRYARNNRGVLFFNLDRFAAAERDFEAARAIEEEGIYLANLAAVAIKRRQLSRAEALLAEASERYPDDPIVERQLGDLALELNDGQRAAEHYRRAAELDPDAAAPHADLGSLYSDIDRGRAESHFREAIRLDPAYPWAYGDLAELVAAREGESAGERVLLAADSLLGRPAWTANELGSFHEFRERAGEAERYYREAIRRNPDYVYAYSNLADLVESQGRIDEAREWLVAASSRFEGNPIPFAELGAFFYRRARLEDAAEAYRQALAADSSYLPAVSGLAYIEADAGRYDSAVRHYARAAARNPARYRLEVFARHLESRAGAHERANEMDAAVEASQRAHEVAPQRVSPLRRLAQLHYLTQRPDSALRYIEQAMERIETYEHGSLAQAHTVRALILLDLNRNAEALAELDAADALRIRADLRTRAIVLWNAGRSEEARRLHEQAERQPAPVRYSESTLAIERRIGG